MRRMHVSESTCPVCNSAAGAAFVEIPQVPIHCNLLWKSRDEGLAAPKGDIHLGFCGECEHTFNLVFNPDLMQYEEDYENSLHFSSRFQDYASSLSEQLIKRYNLHGKNIIEIGCGKGEFLALLCAGGGNHGVGFDPSYDGRKESGGATDNITFIRDFYSEAYAGYPADFICCRQVLEHIQNPRIFLSQLRRAIGDRWDTVVFFEVPNVLYTLRDLGIWDIIYEHCSYFSSASLARVFSETGFKIIQLYETYEGQFLCIEALPSESSIESRYDTWGDIGEITHHVAVFADKYRSKVETWRCNLKRIERVSQRVVIWGAGSKGVTFLNLLKIHDEIMYVVDLNTDKRGMYIAGTGQQIVSPNFLQGYQADVVVMMNAIYKTEIQQLVESLGMTTEFLYA